MVFYLIGLGLGGAEDITVRGLEIVKRCHKVYLESFTSILSYGLGNEKKKLEDFYGCPLYEADRDMVEQNIETILEEAKDKDVALLIVGDPFGATTHTDLVVRAHQLGSKVEVIHNASIISAVGCCGLQLYSYGQVVSIPLWTDDWRPDSFYDKILQNRSNNLHSLCLLDIKTKERSINDLMKGRDVFQPPHFMSCAEAAHQLLSITHQRESNFSEDHLSESSMVIGMARIGWPDQKIVYCMLKDIITRELGPPLHSLVIPSQTLHPMEIEMLKMFF